MGRGESRRGSVRVFRRASRAKARRIMVPGAEGSMWIFGEGWEDML